MYKIVKRRRVLPPSIEVKDISEVSKSVIDGGGFGNVRKGKIGCLEVALKVPRIFDRYDLEKGLKVNDAIHMHE